MSNIMEAICAAMDCLDQTKRSLVVHPDNEAAVREVVAGSLYPSLYEVVVNPYTPADKVFVVPHLKTLLSPIRSAKPDGATS